MRTKEEIRQLIYRKRQSIKAEWVLEKSRAAGRKLVTMREFGEADVICCYIALSGEVMTQMILERCWKTGKKVCVPVYMKKTNSYKLACFEKSARLAEGRYGVPEPADAVFVASGEVDFAVVPAVAFDPAGGRVGHGRGYYDRMLEGMQKQVFKAGLAFEFQVLGCVPMDAGDVRMDVVVTEKRVIRSAGGAV